MQVEQERKGPKGHRIFITLLNILLAVLVYWLLGFMIDDISEQRGPDFADIEKSYLDQKLVNKKTDLITQSDKLSKQIETQREQLAIIQTSITSYRDTMNQLLDLQKVSVQKGMPFSSESQINLRSVTQRYLAYQQQFQDLNQSIAKHNLEEQQLQSQLNDVEASLSKQSKRSYTAYDALMLKHNLYMAGLQLLVLLPLLILTVYCYRKYRASIYKRMLLAINIAVIIKIILVMHEHFPSRFFKYIFIIALIYLTVRVLVSMLRMAVAPKLNWLMKQYREAYQKQQCPMCQYPIQPGVLKFFPSQNNLKNPIEMSMDYLEHTEAYTCPSCGERLFEKCTSCNHTRHSLLTYCDTCGDEKSIKEPVCSESNVSSHLS